jgi:hypothetical protein
MGIALRNYQYMDDVKNVDDKVVFTDRMWDAIQHAKRDGMWGWGCVCVCVWGVCVGVGVCVCVYLILKWFTFAVITELTMRNEVSAAYVDGKA